jgi:hypothetical protein
MLSLVNHCEMGVAEVNTTTIINVFPSRGKGLPLSKKQNYRYPLMKA